MNLTENELKAIEERMEQENLYIKKYRFFAKECHDEKLKQLCNQIADSHQQHFNTLMGYLQ